MELFLDTLSILPDDTMIEILTYLPVKNLGYNQSVNTRWYKLINKPILWQGVYYLRFGSTLTETNKTYAYQIRQSANFMFKPLVIKINHDVKKKIFTSEKILYAINNNYYNLLVNEMEEFTGKPIKLDIVASNLVYNAALNNNPYMIKYLIRQGFSADGVFINTIPLYYSAKMGNLDSVKTLVEFGAKIDITTRENLTPFSIASLNGHLDVMKFLYSHGANIEGFSNNGYTPLYIACQENNLACVKFLVENGANIEVKYANQCTPLYVATRLGHHLIVKYLCEMSADTNVMDNDGSTPLYIACQNGYWRCVKLLLKFGSTVKPTYSTKYSPLYIACQNGHHKVVDVLIKAHIDVNHVGPNGLSALHVACQNQKILCIKLLIKNGVNCNFIYGAGFTSLYLSSECGYYDIVKLLVPHCNINMATDHGMTALDTAIINGHFKIVKYLIRNGADVLNINNKTIEDTYRNGFVEIAEYLDTVIKDIILSMPIEIPPIEPIITTNEKQNKSIKKYFKKFIPKNLIQKK